MPWNENNSPSELRNEVMKFPEVRLFAVFLRLFDLEVLFRLLRVDVFFATSVSKRGDYSIAARKCSRTMLKSNHGALRANGSS